MSFVARSLSLGSRLFSPRLARRLCLAASLSAAVVSASWASAAAAAAPPHIVFILADDMGYGDVQCQNPQSKIPTPNLDRIAAEGRRFTDAHTTSSVCTPTRYGILTGRYNWRSRLKSGVLGGWSPPLIENDRLTVASLLKQNGYYTAVVGKWHLGLGWQDNDATRPLTAGPNTLGFDHSFLVPASLDMSPYCYVVDHRVPNPPTEKVSARVFGRVGVRTPGLVPEDVLGDLTRHTVEVITEHAKARGDQPLFLYFPLTAPHTPVAPSGEFQGKTDSKYGDFVNEVDWSVGQVMDALGKAGMAENTLLIFTADNGASPNAASSAIAKGHAPNRPYRGGKSTIWEGGHRVPFIVRWPARIEGGTTCSQTICTADLMATCAEIVGAELPDNAGEDSFSFLPQLQAEPNDQAVRPTTIHHSISGAFAIRKGPWKLITVSGGGGWDTKDWGMPKVPVDRSVPMQLYDLVEDSGEKNNVYARHPRIVDELLAELTELVNRGRSAPGAPQHNDGKGPWRQLNWMKPADYTNGQVTR